MDVSNHSVSTLLQDERMNVSVGVQTEQAITLRRKLDLDKTISTPPSELRKQIYYLSDQLTEAYEFHDLEIQVLKEEYELQSGDSKTDDKNVKDLEKSLKDAELIIIETNKEISELKTINQDLNQKLKDEFSKYEALKLQCEDQVSKLNVNLKKKDLEIENLKKDKDDFDFRLELMTENYNRKITELKSALEKKNEKDSENEKVAEFQRKLNEENEKTKELLKKLDNLTLELYSNKEKAKSLEAQLAEVSLKRKVSLKDTSLQTDDEIVQENVDKFTEIFTQTETTENKDNSAQTNDDALNSSNEDIDEIRGSFEKQMKELKDDYNNKLKSLESSNDRLEESNSSLTQKLNELQTETDKLQEKISSLNEELKSANEGMEMLRNAERDWEFKVEELKLEKETLNSIAANKDEKLDMLIAELSEMKKKLEESENGLKEHIKDSETYIDLLTSEKAELENWIKTKEEEIHNLNLTVENQLMKLQTDAEFKMAELKEMHEVEVRNLKNDNDALSEQIETIKNMYETELLKFVNKIQDRNESEVNHDSSEECSRDDTLTERITKIKTERDSIVEMYNSRLMEASISITDNIKTEQSTVIRQSSVNELMPLVPVPSWDDTIGSYNLHTMDEENMKLKINSESTMMEFVNEFAKVMLRENIIKPEELKTCTNVFYSLFNKYLTLLEMYARLKSDFDEYRSNEEKERFDIVNRTVRYLDVLCSQLEVSGSSLNLSNSFTFQEGLPSSTILEEDYTEMEISAINNVTMSKDPLSLTRDATPMKTPYKSAKKPNQFQFKTPLRSVSKPKQTKPESVKKAMSSTPAPAKNANDTRLLELKNSVIRKDKELNELKELYNRKIGSAEEIIQETLKSSAHLEERITTLETLLVELQSDKDNLVRENSGLKESLTKTAEEITEIRDKLVVEIISLNPGLKGTFTDSSVTDLLSVFLNTIMESCQKMPEELSDKMASEMKSLAEKNEIYESQLFESAKEMNLLKEMNAALLEEKEIIEKEISDQKDEIATLREETCELKGLRTKLKDLEERMAENDSILKTEIYLKENTLKDLQKLKSFFEEVEIENSNLKQKIEQSDKAMRDLRTELMLAKKNQVSNEMKEDELMKEIEQLKSILSDTEDKNKDLRIMIDNFEEEVTTAKGNNKYKACQLELLNNKITQAENVIQERDQIIHELKKKIADAEAKLESGSLELSQLSEKLRETVEGCKESINEEIEALKSKLTSADAELTSKIEIIQELSSKLAEAVEKAQSQEETITSLRERIAELEESKSAAEKDMTEQIEHLKAKVVASESDLAVELTKSKEEKMQNEEAIAGMKRNLDELEASKAKLESTLEKYREVERVVADETESLKTKLALSEAELKEKIEKLAELTEMIEKTRESQVKDGEIIESLKSQVREMEEDRVRLGELRENEKFMTEKIEDLNCKLEASKKEIEETKEVQVRSDDIISTLEKEIKELKNDNLKIKSLEGVIDELNLKLSSAESDLSVKVEMIEKITSELQEAGKSKATDEETISTLNEEIKGLKTVQNELETVRSEKETLSSRVNELSTSEKVLTDEIDELRKTLDEKLAKLDEIEQDLSKSRNALEELEADNERRQQIESELIRVTSELESRNNELETVNGELKQRVSSFEALYEMNCKENELMRLELQSSKDETDTLRTELKKLEAKIDELEGVNQSESEKCRELESVKVALTQELKSCQDNKDILKDVLLDIDARLGVPTVPCVGTAEWREAVMEKVNNLFALHRQELENLKAELKNSTEASRTLQTEIDRLNAVNTSQKLEVSLPLKTPPMRKNRPGDSPSFISRRLEKLETLNDLLTGTLEKIIRALDIPFEGNLFSVGLYESSESEIMRHISSLNIAKKNDSEDFEELSKSAKELRNAMSSVVMHLGLPEGTVSGQSIISQIDKMKKDFLDRIDVLRQDNQHLDDDNSLLQTEMKKLVEANNANKKLQEELNCEIETLKSEVANLHAKSKTTRKSDLCNRKMDKLEELYQSVVDLMKEMLALTGMKNFTRFSTMRRFDVERKKVWDHFYGWVTSKMNELEELKSRMKELDEECESYTKVIVESRQETERVWEKSRAEVKNLEIQVAQLQEENKSLAAERDMLTSRLKGGGDVRDCKADNDTKRIDELTKQNVALQSKTKDLEESLTEAKKQIEELDEECESYAKVIKETQRESLLCEETKNEIAALKEEVEKIVKEKETLQEKIRLLESSKEHKKGSADSRKELKELKRTVALREMKILELEQLNEKNIIHKSQIEYLEKSVSVLKDQLAQEETKNRKLQTEVKELSTRVQARKGSDDVELLDQLRPRDSLGMAALHQIDDKEKLSKLEKDNRMLKEICRRRYNEIKRLETENQTLKGHERTTKYSRQELEPDGFAHQDKMLQHEIQQMLKMLSSAAASAGPVKHPHSKD